MWKDGVCLGIKATTGEVIMGKLEWRVTHKNVPPEDSNEKDRTEAIWRCSWRSRGARTKTMPTWMVSV